MNLLEKMDTVLKYLYEYSGSNPTENDIVENTKIDVGEVRDILIQLLDDKMLRMELDGTFYHVYKDNKDCHFLITFNGKYFCETIGGYKGKTKLETDDEKRKIRNDSMLVVGTWLAGIAGIFLFAMELIKFCRSLSNC